jgi:hypothetical protein
LVGLHACDRYILRCGFHNLCRRPILDPDAIAEAMVTDRRTVDRSLREARIILRDVFNADGTLFLNR